MHIHTLPGRFTRHQLAIHWVRGGRQHVTFGRRTVVLDDDTYLIVNAGTTYDVRFASPAPLRARSVHFPDGLAEEVLGQLGAELDAVSFSEHLQLHDALVSPVLRFLESHLDQGITEEGWYEEHLRFLLERMFRKEQEILRCRAAVNAVRPGTRREIYRRVAFATDYIHSHYERPIALADIAAAAALSPHHLLRLFKLVHRCTPRDFVQKKRTAVAARLIENTGLTLEEIAHRVGFEDRGTLSRRVRRVYGLNPRQMRPTGRTRGRAA